MFPSYMVLFEQRFLEVVNNIANSFPASQVAAMQGAASTMRFPYWDWAAIPPNGDPTLPTEVKNLTVTVNGPNGQVTINNPLYRYDFQDNSQLGNPPYDTTWNHTYRYPTSNQADAFSIESAAVASIENARGDNQRRVYQMITACSDYLSFSNTASGAGSNNPVCAESIEDVHNQIHTDAGGPRTANVFGGHMAELQWAGFDPLFWLHHCNVDRLFAMWQTYNPGSYGANQLAQGPTWTIAPNSNQGPNSPLTPFHRDARGTFWTTNDVQDWSATFGYTYPEFADSDGSQGAIVSYVRALYGPSATATAGSSKRDAAPEPNYSSGAWSASSSTAAWSSTSSVADYSAASWSASSSPNSYTVTSSSAGWSSSSSPETRSSSPVSYTPASSFAGWSSTSSAAACTTSTSQQYVANVKSPRYTGTYVIYLFEGSPECEDSETWSDDSHLLGKRAVLSMNSMASNVLSSGTIPLTVQINNAIDSGSCSGTADDEVRSYLQSNVQVRIKGLGAGFEPCDLSNLDITVYSATLSECSDLTVKPTWSNWNEVFNIIHCASGSLSSSASPYSASMSSTSSWVASPSSSVWESISTASSLVGSSSSAWESTVPASSWAAASSSAWGSTTPTSGWQASSSTGWESTKPTSSW